MDAKRRTHLVAVGVGLIAVVLAIIVAWPESADTKTCRLLQEFVNLPTQKMALPYFGRSFHEIQTDFDSLGARAAPQLFRNLSSGSPRERSLAVRQLARINCESVGNRLSFWLDDDDLIVKYDCVDAMGLLKNRQAVPKLIDFLNSDDEDLRYRAAISLGLIGDQIAVGPLVSRLNDRSVYVRAHAAQALGRLGNVKAAANLIELVAMDRDTWVIKSAVEGLGTIGDNKALPVLRRIANGSNSDLSQAASKSIELIERRLSRLPRE